MCGSWGVDKQLSAPFVLLGPSCCVSRLRRPGLSQQDKQLSMECYGSLRGPKAAGGVGTNSYPWSRKSPGRAFAVAARLDKLLSMRQKSLGRAHVLLRRRDKLLSMIEKSGAGHFEAAWPQFFGRLGSRASVVAHCPALLFDRQERRRARCSSLPKVDKQLSCLAKIRGGSSLGDEWTNGYP